MQVPMKPGAGIATLLLGLALLPRALPAEEGGEAAKTPKTPVHLQLNQLIRAGAGVPSLAATPAEASPAALGEETLVLEPMIVEEEKLKGLPPPETKTEKFFRTGTLWEKVGRRFTKRFWMKGDQGIMFTLSW